MRESQSRSYFSALLYNIVDCKRQEDKRQTFLPILRKEFLSVKLKEKIAARPGKSPELHTHPLNPNSGQTQASPVETLDAAPLDLEGLGYSQLLTSWA